jgi:hypothetical protein
MAMDKGKTKDHSTVMVLGSQTLGRPDGRVAIRLETKELGSIAFEVDQRAIDALRRQLVVAEQFLHQKSRQA